MFSFTLKRKKVKVVSRNKETNTKTREKELREEDRREADG